MHQAGGRRTEGARIGRTGLAGLVALPALAAVLLRPEIMTLPQALLALAVVAIGCLPLALWALGIGRSFLPLAPIIGLFHAIYFGVSLFLIDLAKAREAVKVYAIEPVEALNTGAIAASAVGLACVLGGYYLVRGLPIAVPRVRIAERSPAAMTLTAWSLAALLLALLYVPGLKGFSAAAQLADFLPFVVLGLLLALWRQGRLSAAERMVGLFGLVPLVLLSTLSQGLLSYTALLVLFLVVLDWRMTGRRLPAGWFALLFGLLLLAYDARTHVRPPPPSPPVAGAPVGEVVGRQVAYIGSLLWAMPAYIGERLEGKPEHDAGSPFLRRFSYGLVFSAVADRTPGPVEYWQGHSYRNLLANFVPRAVWPDKPREEVGGEFGKRYGFLNPADAATSVNLPWLVEAYVNFGWSGIVGVMLLIGAYLAVLERILIGTSPSLVEAAVGSAFLFRLGFPESNFTVMTGSIVPVAVVVYALLFLMNRLPLRP